MHVGSVKQKKTLGDFCKLKDQIESVQKNQLQATERICIFG